MSIWGLMRKRIGLRELQVGMYVAEMETGNRSGQKGFSPFLISSPSDIQRVIDSNVRTVVIDIGRGRDVGGMIGQPFDHAQFEGLLHATFSPNEIKRAKQNIEDTRPHIRELLVQARSNKAFASDAADAAVERIMSAASDNAGALIGVAKLKAKDEVTFLHSLAVSALMISFGRSLGLDEDFVRQLGTGGLVHDLGKLALPDSILKSSGKPTTEAYALIQTHPERGYEMVSEMPGIPPAVQDICRYHHEKIDGSGYPFGLVGEQIPYVSRLAAICDVYDALTTIRPYKRAWSQTEAIDVMMKSNGHFDDKLLAAFISEMVISGTLH